MVAGDGETPWLSAVGMLPDIMKKKIITSPTDQMALVFYNTRETRNDQV